MPLRRSLADELVDALHTENDQLQAQAAEQLDELKAAVDRKDQRYFEMEDQYNALKQDFNELNEKYVIL